MQEVRQKPLGMPATQSDDNEQIVYAVLTVHGAKQALQTLIGHTESQGGLSTNYLRVPERLEVGEHHWFRLTCLQTLFKG